jgi:hypothetical protein
VYLIAYAGALLILLAYLGVRLKAANQSLEVRVMNARASCRKRCNT